MSDVVVITGGGSGMGLEAAKYMAPEKIIVLSGRTVFRLEHAANTLREMGLTAYAHACDTSDRESVRKLAGYAKSLGTVRNVINAAGLSPNMADGEKLLRINALGTVYVNQEFSRVMEKGSVILDVSSNSAYALPGFVAKIAQRSYPLAVTNEKKFLKKMLKFAALPRTDYEKAGFAYALSKNFVCWYAGKCAFDYGKQGIRVLSLSPGLIATDMGKLEEKEGGAMIPFTAEERMGTPAELGYAIATAADERNGYLAGIDILCDGGSITGRDFKRNIRRNYEDNILQQRLAL